MGANTYIVNGPNFMVKAIAEESGVRMPSFFGYMLYSGLILLPIFVLVTLLFPLSLAWSAARLARAAFGVGRRQAAGGPERDAGRGGGPAARGPGGGITSQ